MNNVTKRIITGLLLFLLLIIFLFYLPPFYFSAALLLMLAEVVLVEWPTLARTSTWLWLVTPAYLFVPFGCLISLNYYSPWLLFLLFTFVALFDTAAYVAGKIAGRHKIAPRISPGKTWEGFCGGFLALLFAMLLLSHKENNTFIASFMLALIIACLALMGDLAESWLKRRANIKDSGSLLPGHGGLLDRIDGLLPVSIFFYIVKSSMLTLFGQ